MPKKTIMDFDIDRFAQAFQEQMEQSGGPHTEVTWQDFAAIVRKVRPNATDEACQIVFQAIKDGTLNRSH
jgi:hypothetical protein